MALIRRSFMLSIVCFCFAGCSKAVPNLAEVEGTLKFRGKPLSGVMVYFVPDAQEGCLCPPSSGWTDDEGHYQLTCQAPPRPGAVVGIHHVTILDPDSFDEVPGSPEERASEKRKKRKPRKDQIEMKYMMPSQTPLLTEVHPGGPQVIDFNVK